ncbi:ATP-binding protein [Paenibacillus mesophilus]|uniref:ATP-binding protein n=1 Tax=Paenibacillus mesophilus TaxID=2582849 RepID=UPI00110E3EDD|nr:ATP-binding protein [Paenibacillus mesophilus]TMV49549.1 ATP-binding protein [Paenibacillus mesophilus]
MSIVISQPSATPVIHALRSLGYNAGTAIADLIDNSLDAKATKIILLFKCFGNDGAIIIADNGHGMNEDTLQAAMNIGSKDPRADRQPNELGRFGMGLKTASFSLGKRLSVLTKHNGIYAQRCWDLDHVSQCNEWQLFTAIPDEVRQFMCDFEGDSGTVICIDKLDRFMGAGGVNTIHESSFYAKVRRIHHHLEFVFHSIIENGKVQVILNGNELDPWDPFMVKHPSTLEGETQVLNINGNKIKVKYYVLPHASFLNEMEYKRAGGSRGWRDHQGFYIYRENRLLHYGDWLGMFQKDTSSQLARVRIDLPNAADEDWQVDIKKSAVIPPDNAKTRLETIARFVRKISRDVFYYRTQGSHPSQTFKGSLNTWELSGSDEGQQFVLNRNHPILSEIQEKIDDETSKLLNLYLKFVQLGSPSNITDSPKVEEESIQIVTDAMKELVIQFASTLIKLQVVQNMQQLIDALVTQPAFDGLNRKTLKSIIEEANVSHE